MFWSGLDQIFDACRTPKGNDCYGVLLSSHKSVIWNCILGIESCFLPLCGERNMTHVREDKHAALSPTGCRQERCNLERIIEMKGCQLEYRRSVK